MCFKRCGSRFLGQCGQVSTPFSKAVINILLCLFWYQTKLKITCKDPYIQWRNLFTLHLGWTSMSLSGNSIYIFATLLAS